MKTNQEIPNVVGRMDPVVEALGRGEWGEARALLVKEAARRDEEIQADSAALDKRLEQALQLCGFLERIDRGEGLDEIRAACGVVPEEENPCPWWPSMIQGGPETLRARFECKPEVGMMMIPDRDSRGALLGRGRLVHAGDDFRECDPDVWFVYGLDGWVGKCKPHLRLVNREGEGVFVEPATAKKEVKP